MRRDGAGWAVSKPRRRAHGRATRRRGAKAPRRSRQPDWAAYHNMSSLGLALGEAEARGLLTMFSRFISV